MRSDKAWKIELGEHRWTMFTYPRSAGDGLRLLGSIARGQQIGALAQTPDGRYVQVNGDHVIALSHGQVRRELRKIEAAHPRRPSLIERSGRAVVVTIKPRRVIMQAGAPSPMPQMQEVLIGSAGSVPSIGTGRRLSIAGIDRGQEAETMARQTLAP